MLYDVAGDQYLVSNINGQPLDKDGNGSVSLDELSSALKGKGHHHFVDRNLVAEVEGNKVRLSAIGAVAVTMEQEK